MNINYRETQYNFLDSVPVSSRDPNGPRVMSAQLTLSIENLVIFAIVSIMVLLFCFSLGVERGKRLVLSDGIEAGNPQGQTAPAAPAKGVTAEADDVIAPGDARKNVLDAFVSSWRDKGKAAAPDVQPAAATATSEPKPAQQAVVPAPEKAPKKEPAVVAAASGPYTVQVASYKSQKTAKREADSLKQKGYRDVYVLPKGSFVIVCVGSFSKKAEATSFTRQLKNRYQDPLVRRL